MGTWNYVINDSFTEQYGEGSAARYAQMLGDVASRVRPGDRDGAVALLDSAFEQLGFDMPAKTSDQLAENLTMEEHDLLVISDGAGAVIGEYPIHSDGRTSREEQRQHVAPDDRGRPMCS